MKVEGIELKKTSLGLSDNEIKFILCCISMSMNEGMYGMPKGMYESFDSLLTKIGVPQERLETFKEEMEYSCGRLTISE